MQKTSLSRKVKTSCPTQQIGKSGTTPNQLEEEIDIVKVKYLAAYLSPLPEYVGTANCYRHA
jgi:hypothetical protein